MNNVFGFPVHVIDSDKLPEDYFALLSRNQMTVRSGGKFYQINLRNIAQMRDKLVVGPNAIKLFEEK